MGSVPLLKIEENRIEENAEVYAFELTEYEMEMRDAGK